MGEIKTHDEVILELRKIKDDLARANNYDIKKILTEARSRQKTTHRAILSPPVRKNAKRVM
jgi:hypothetical protein